MKAATSESSYIGICVKLSSSHVKTTFIASFVGKLISNFHVHKSAFITSFVQQMLAAAFNICPFTYISQLIIVFCWFYRLRVYFTYLCILFLKKKAFLRIETFCTISHDLYKKRINQKLFSLFFWGGGRW